MMAMIRTTRTNLTTMLMMTMLMSMFHVGGKYCLGFGYENNDES